MWDESDLVCKVWITMLARKDSDHVYRGTAYALAKQARKTEGEVLEALRVLSSPDTKRSEPQEFEGRRIKAVPEGWLILNGEKYRAMMAEEMKRARWRRAQARKRAKLKALGNHKPLAGEAGAVRGFEATGEMTMPHEFERNGEPPANSPL